MVQKYRALSSQLQTIETLCGHNFPDDYKFFLLWSNGGKGQISQVYLSLWRVEEIVTLNNDYQINFYLPNILAIGSAGGGEAFCLDYRERQASPSLIRVPFGDLSYDSFEMIGDTFEDGLKNLLKS